MKLESRYVHVNYFGIVTVVKNTGYLATEQDGRVFWYSSIPTLNYNYTTWSVCRGLITPLFNVNLDGIDWKESLKKVGDILL